MKRVFGFCIFRVNTCFYSRSTVDPTRSLSVEPLLHYRFLVARSVVEIIETLSGRAVFIRAQKKAIFQMEREEVTTGFVVSYWPTYF